MLRTEQVKEDGSDVIDSDSGETIFTVWRAEGESDGALVIRAGCIAKCINDEIKRNRGKNQEQL